MLSILYLNKVRKGFSLVELVIIISILGILSSMSIPVFEGCREKVNGRVCMTNCSQMTILYEGYLVIEGIKHPDLIFTMCLQDYGKDVCPDQGQVIYSDSYVCCVIHEVTDNYSGNNEKVPYL